MDIVLDLNLTKKSKVKTENKFYPLPLPLIIDYLPREMTASPAKGQSISWGELLIIHFFVVLGALRGEYKAVKVFDRITG